MRVSSDMALDMSALSRAPSGPPSGETACRLNARHKAIIVQGIVVRAPVRVVSVVLRFARKSISPPKLQSFHRNLSKKYRGVVLFLLPSLATGKRTRIGGLIARSPKLRKGTTGSYDATPPSAGPKSALIFYLQASKDEFRERKGNTNCEALIPEGPPRVMGN